jgi:diguanylate cyclase (GGDEF)-like protein
MILKYANVLVEDNCLIIAHKLKQELSSQEFQVHYFDTSFEAIEIVKHKSIDLVIIHNINLLKELRETYSKINLPILLITKNSSNIASEIYEYANDFLNISVLNEDLIPKIILTLNRCQRLKNLVELTNKDFLTDVYNKRYFYDKAQEIYDTSENIAMCMIDIDNFKMINDTYGHLVGDYAIKELANILKKNIKGKDLVARFGGDEFCILLQDISDKHAKLLLKQIQEEVKNNFFVAFDEVYISFTISTGITTSKGDSLHQMINTSDINLLNSKTFKPKVKICTNCKKHSYSLEHA